MADNSPAAAAGIEPFFDYVVGVDGQPLSAGMAGGNSSTHLIEEMLAKIVDEHEGHYLDLQIWSSKRMELRGEQETMATTPSCVQRSAN